MLLNLSDKLKAGMEFKTPVLFGQKPKGESKPKHKTRQRIYDSYELAYSQHRYLQGLADGLLGKFDLELEQVNAKHPSWFLVRQGDKLEYDFNSQLWFTQGAGEMITSQIPARSKAMAKLQEELDLIFKILRAELNAKFKKFKDLEFHLVHRQVICTSSAYASHVRSIRKDINSDLQYRKGLQDSTQMRFKPLRSVVDYTVTSQWMPNLIK